MIIAPLPDISNEELLRMTGTLPVDRIEALIDSEAHFNQVEDIAPCIMEAKCMYPNEGFLQPLIDKVSAVAKNTRGINRIELDEAVTMLTALQSFVSGNSEYGRDELKKALKCIEERT